MTLRCLEEVRRRSEILYGRRERDSEATCSDDAAKKSKCSKSWRSGVGHIDSLQDPKN